MAFEILHFIRLLLVHMTYLVYPYRIWYLCITNADTAGYASKPALVICIIWFVFHAAIQLVLLTYGIKERPIMTKSWFLVYMFCFTFVTMPPYMFTFKMLYDIAETRLKQKVGNISDVLDLIHVSIEEGDYVIFQVAMVILLLTYIVYPLPRRSYDVGAYLALAVEFLNAFDIMDMLGDIAFIRHYGKGWKAIYYMSMSISVLSLSFPINIEDDFVDFPTYFFGLAIRFMSQKKGRQNVAKNGKTNDGFKFEAEDNSKEVVCSCVLKESSENESKKVIESSGTHKHESEGPRNQKSIMERLETKQHDREKNGTKESSIERLGTQNIRDLRSGTEQNSGGKSDAYSDGHSTIPRLESGHKSDLESEERRPTPMRSGKETTRERRVRETIKRIVKTAATIIFTDAMFAAIRLQIMINEHSVDHGFNMVVKNLILAVLHFLYLVKHIKMLKTLRHS